MWSTIKPLVWTSLNAALVTVFISFLNNLGRRVYFVTLLACQFKLRPLGQMAWHPTVLFLIWCANNNSKTQRPVQTTVYHSSQLGNIESFSLRLSLPNTHTHTLSQLKHQSDTLMSWNFIPSCWFLNVTSRCRRFSGHDDWLSMTGPGVELGIFWNSSTGLSFVIVHLSVGAIPKA